MKEPRNPVMNPIGSNHIESIAFIVAAALIIIVIYLLPGSDIATNHHNAKHIVVRLPITILVLILIHKRVITIPEHIYQFNGIFIASTCMVFIILLSAVAMPNILLTTESLQSALGVSSLVLALVFYGRVSRSIATTMKDERD